MTSSLEALIGPSADPRDDRPLAGPAVMVEMPRFGAHQLCAPMMVPTSKTVARPARPLVETPRAFPWWAVLAALSSLVIVVMLASLAA